MKIRIEDITMQIARRFLPSDRERRIPGRYRPLRETRYVLDARKRTAFFSATAQGHFPALARNHKLPEFRPPAGVISPLANQAVDATIPPPPAPKAPSASGTGVKGAFGKIGAVLFGAPDICYRPSLTLGGMPRKKDDEFNFG